MSAYRLAIVVLSFLSLACSDMALNPAVLDGNYRGTFTITHSTGLVQSGNVTFTFTGAQYTCTPERLYLPPSGGGSFELVGQAIRLRDTAVHTAEFDGTLILGGEFSFLFDGFHRDSSALS
jgi:hypothetical protein